MTRTQENILGGAILLAVILCIAVVLSVFRDEAKFARQERWNAENQERWTAAKAQFDAGFEAGFEAGAIAAHTGKVEVKAVMFNEKGEPVRFEVNPVVEAKP